MSAPLPTYACLEIVAIEQPTGEDFVVGVGILVVLAALSTHKRKQLLNHEDQTVKFAL